MNGIEFFQDKTKKELIEIISVQIEEHQKMLCEINQLKSQLVKVVDGATGKSPCAKYCEAVATKVEFRKLRAENEALYEDNKALRDYVASLINTLPKLKADAIREAAQLVMYEYEGEARNRDIAEYLEDYADKLERGKE